MSFYLVRQMLALKAKQVVGSARKPLTSARSDDNLPPALRRFRTGNRVDFGPSIATAVLAQGAGSLMHWPSAPCRVAGYEVSNVVEGKTRRHRFYLDNETHCIQAITDWDGNLIPDELRLLEFRAQISPQSIEEWFVWRPSVVVDISEHDDRNYPQSITGYHKERQFDEGQTGERDTYALIGYQTFDLQGDNDEVLAQYGRVWGSESKVQELPREWQARLFVDPNGPENRLRHRGMLYARMTSQDAAGNALPGAVAEYVWIAAIEGTTGAWIEIALAVNLLMTDVDTPDFV